jgi:hypothetical protein
MPTVEKLTKQQAEELWYDWCKKNDREADSNSLIEWDSHHNLGEKILDYARAKKDGYFMHLQMQARAWISSLAMHVKSPGGDTVVQFAYRTEDGRQTPVRDFTDPDILFNATKFKQRSVHAIRRMYIMQNKIGPVGESLRQKLVSDFIEAEAAAYESTKPE